MSHGIWKGTRGFGLVSIAVEPSPAEAPEQEDIVKGYAVSKDQYVLLIFDSIPGRF